MERESLHKAARYVGGTPALRVLAVASAVAGAAGTLAAPAMIGSAIDRMGGGASAPGVLALILGELALVYVIANLFQWVLGRVTNRISYLTTRNLRAELFAKLGRLPLEFFDTTAHGDVISRFINDVDTVSDGLLQGLAQVLSGVAMILGAAVFMALTDLRMALLVAVLTPLSVFTARAIAKSTRTHFRDQAQIVGSLNGYAEEMIAGRKEVRLFRLEDAAMERFAGMNARLQTVGVTAQFHSSLANPSTRLVNNIAYTVVGVVGSLAALHGTLTIGGISSFLIYSTLFAKPFNDITNVLTQLQAASASARRIFAVLELPAEADAPEGTTLPDPAGNITFEKVCFAYDPARPLIENLNLDIPYGESVAIVGRTGAGKTTLVNLIMRFYDVDNGRITLGGRDIRGFRRDDLRRCFGMVLQDTWLFSGTIRENIAYGRPGATEAEVVEAARSAGAHDFIVRLPEGYDTPVSDAGDDLSQGQKQLLTIARVMLADPPMFILDEATSSIDTRTELHVQEAMKRLTAGRTSFVIAHRLSTVRDAGIILVLEDGHIVESGTHGELLKLGGSYARFYANRLDTVAEA